MAGMYHSITVCITHVYQVPQIGRVQGLYPSRDERGGHQPRRLGTESRLPGHSDGSEPCYQQQVIIIIIMRLAVKM